MDASMMITILIVVVMKENGDVKLKKTTFTAVNQVKLFLLVLSKF
jgi:hypothetical protein